MSLTDPLARGNSPLVPGTPPAQPPPSASSTIDYTQYRGQTPMQIYTSNPNGLPPGWDWSAFDQANGTTYNTTSPSGNPVTTGPGPLPVPASGTGNPLDRNNSPLVSGYGVPSPGGPALPTSTPYAGTVPGTAPAGMGINTKVGVANPIASTTQTTPDTSGINSLARGNSPLVSSTAGSTPVTAPAGSGTNPAFTGPSYQDYQNYYSGVDPNSYEGSTHPEYGTQLTQDQWNTLNTAQKWERMNGREAIMPNDPRYQQLFSQLTGSNTQPNEPIVVRYNSPLDPNHDFTDPSKVITTQDGAQIYLRSNMTPGSQRGESTEIPFSTWLTIGAMAAGAITGAGLLAGAGIGPGAAAGVEYGSATGGGAGGVASAAGDFGAEDAGLNMANPFAPPADVPAYTEPITVTAPRGVPEPGGSTIPPIIAPPTSGAPPSPTTTPPPSNTPATTKPSWYPGDQGSWDAINKMYTSGQWALRGYSLYSFANSILNKGSTMPGSVGNPNGTSSGNPLDTAANWYLDQNIINQYQDQVGQYLNKGDYNQQYRPGQLAQLNQWLTDPGSMLKNDSAYQQMRQQGLDNEDRMLNSKGFNISGNEMGDLEKYGENLDYTHIKDVTDSLRNAADQGNPNQLYGSAINSAGFVAGMMSNRNNDLTSAGGISGALKTVGNTISDLLKNGPKLPDGSIDWNNVPDNVRQELNVPDPATDPSGYAQWSAQNSQKWADMPDPGSDPQGYSAWLYQNYSGADGAYGSPDPFDTGSDDSDWSDLYNQIFGP